MRATDMGAALLSIAFIMPVTADEKPIIDWFYGCHTGMKDLPKPERPCWVQSRARIIGKDDGTDGEMYFQVHYSGERKVLRVYMDLGNIQSIELIVRDTHGHLQTVDYMKLTYCSSTFCWADVDISDKYIINISKNKSLGLMMHPASYPNDRDRGFTDIITFKGFLAAIEELRKHDEKAHKE